ncbi:hypothetical protein [Longimicrobium sp.]|jgi:hypothetical protein|uniref:tetratricopeptide repeat protein n=1 Tax=Longimicrobium sp. TaxID=2029185 RepID=UPI002F934268
MNSKHPIITIVLAGALWAAPSLAQTRDEALRDALQPYWHHQYGAAAGQVRALAERPGASAETHAWLAEVYRRLDERTEARREAHRAVAMGDCASFAHTVLGDLYNPQLSSWDEANADSAWAHYRAAVACDPADGGAWMAIHMEALRRDDRQAAEQALRRLHEAGFFSGSALAYNRWVLESLPRGSILLTNGDLDTYPALVLQLAEGVRPDVAVVNVGLLDAAWYAGSVSRAHDLPLPLPVEQLDTITPEYVDSTAAVKYIAYRVVQSWVRSAREGRMQRPVVFARTGDPTLLGVHMDSLVSLGTGYRIPSAGERAGVDLDAVDAALARVVPADYATPAFTPGDRSVVRRTFPNQMAQIVFEVGLWRADQAAERQDWAGARRWIEWAGRFADAARLPPEHRERLQETSDRTRPTEFDAR